MARRFQPGAQPGEHVLQAELVGRRRIPMRHRYVAGLVLGNRDRDADQPRRHRIERCGFGIQAGERRAKDPSDPLVQLPLGEHGLVAHRRSVDWRLDFGWRGVGGDRRRGIGRAVPAAVGVRALEPRAKFEPLVQPAQRLRVGRASLQHLELRHLSRQVCIGQDRDQRARRGQPADGLAQVLARGAVDLLGVLQQVVERAILGEPARGRFRPHLLDARNVIDAVTDQHQIVDDPFRRNSETGDHARTIEAPRRTSVPAHRVQQFDLIADQLRQVLVGTDDHGAKALAAGTLSQGSDHVVGFHPGDFQHGPAERLHRLMDRLDLDGQIIGHRRAIGLVFWE
jgi:hypothetical protein